MAITLDEIKSAFKASKTVNSISQAVEVADKPKISISGLRGAGECFVASAIIENTKGIHLFVLPDKEEAAYLYNDFQTILGEKNVLFFPSSLRFPYQVEVSDKSNILLRAETLEHLSKRKSTCLVITYPK